MSEPAPRPNPDTIRAGDHLTLRYGNGTQHAYVHEAGAKKLSIYRLINRNPRAGRAGTWTGPTAINRVDPRILAITSRPADAPEPPAELDFDPDELLSTLHAASAPTHASASTARPPRDIM